jgi:hypothetical protein
MSHLIGYGFFIIVTFVLVQRLDYGLDEIRSTSYVVWGNLGKTWSAWGEYENSIYRMKNEYVYV